MQRSKLQNIINRAKEISAKKDSPFESFKKSLPMDINDNYRLEAAWKAYGQPSNFQEAKFYGMIESLDGENYLLPSIGYNEDTEEYEYLNKGKENETVAKDIRAWDNDVIPFIKELKLGGFIRIYDEDKDCWKYSKNKSHQTQEEINKFQEGGKSPKKKDWNSYYEFLETLPKNLQKGNDTDTPEGYRMKLLFDNSPDLWTFEDGLKGENPIFVKEDDGYHAPSVLQMPDGHYEFLKSYNHPSLKEEIKWYNSDDAKSFRENYTLKSKNDQGVPLIYYQYVPNNPQAFKQGGQMNVIPEGALHARKNNMELAEKGEITHKGVPVIDNDGNQQAEIEREEIIFNKEVTEKLEKWYKEFKSDESSSTEKDKLAIEAGKLLAKEIIENTDDRTGLIDNVKDKL